ncbi:hypothetical protein PVAP13_2NG049200 [Panicum virgatum]|uniref:Ubiquitin-like domain-containing protein n=1 Tax=Panicum virgatum TaxID=38727 RepID=A0A8T0VGE1_PANVG|nr:hypothetical protein PVAP13_2NG049200 [Panicum virgatum]
MESTSDIQMQHCPEDSETTIEIKIKTLDSQTYNLRVNKCVPVPLLKEKIATVTGILSEQQRLICRGRVLKDDELLSAYHVEDGHTLHLVVRQPGQSALSGNAGSEANQSNSGRRRGPTVARSVVLEAVNVDPGSGELPAFLGQILQSIIGTISTQSSGVPASSDTRPSEPTQSSIPNTVRVELDQNQQAPLLFPSEPAHGSSQPNVIPDALTTMSQYIEFMRDSFRREGFNHDGQAEGNVENRTAGSTSVGGTQNQESQPESASTLGLHTVSLLAETMQSTRQIVVEQAGAMLSQLSAQLGGLQNVTDPAIRRDLQSSAIRSGSLLHNLGSLLLELGRTTMLLRINPVSSEAVVNSGPALYISPSGPNPLMVQPVPFFPGRSVQMGTLFSSLSSQGSVLRPRDVDIHARTGGSVPVASNPSEPVGAQAQQHATRAGDASHANTGEASAGLGGGTPFSVESGVRLLPLGTVVAMPAGISRAPSGSSSGGVSIIYPLITRVQQRANTSGSDERNGQSPNEPAQSNTYPNQRSIPQSSQAHEAGNLESPTDVNVGNGSETSPGQQNGLVTLSHKMDILGSMFPGENVQENSSNQQAPVASTEQGVGRNHATTQTHVSGASEEALRFASMVRQIMPFISQVETQNQSALPDSSSTRSQASCIWECKQSKGWPK